MHRVIEKTVELRYLLYLPDGYDTSERDWPLLIFLHGSGERGSELDSLKIYGPPMMIEQGHDFPFIVASPQCPAGQWLTLEELVALLDELTESYRVDADRVYVTGLSLGGRATWALAAAIPDRLAAIVPICGRGRPDTAEQIGDMAIWVFHGAKDGTVPLSSSTEMVNALYSAGSNPRFTVYPEAGHRQAWEKAYADPALWTWLEAQSRSRE